MAAMHSSEGSAKVGLAKADRLTRTADVPVLANTDSLVKSLTAELATAKWLTKDRRAGDQATISGAQGAQARVGRRAHRGRSQRLAARASATHPCLAQAHHLAADSHLVLQRVGRIRSP